MASRRQITSDYEGRSAQAPGMMRHGPFPGLGPSAGHHSLERLPHHDIGGNKVAVQAAEIEQLVGDNQKLATTHMALRQELIASQHELQRLKAHIRSIQTESDIQVRVLMDKIAKMEVDIRAGESLKKELQQAHAEAQSLVIARQELTARIQQVTQEMEKSRVDLKKLPEMHVELDSLRQEHHRLRATFEYEKSINIEQVEQMQAMEKNMVGMARELEKLRTEVMNAETRARVPIPYGGPYMNSDSSYPPPPPPTGPYMNSDPSYPPPPPPPTQGSGGPYMNSDPSYPPPPPPTQGSGGPYMNSDPSYPPPPPPPPTQGSGGSYMNSDPSYPPPPPPTQGSGPYMNPDPAIPPHTQGSGGPYTNPDPSYPPPPPPAQGNGPYVDGYGRPFPMGAVAAGEGMNPYIGGNVPNSGSGAVWGGGAYDPSSVAQR